jgi:hypothetical protein
LEYTGRRRRVLGLEDGVYGMYPTDDSHSIFSFAPQGKHPKSIPNYTEYRPIRRVGIARVHPHSGLQPRVQSIHFPPHHLDKPNPKGKHHKPKPKYKGFAFINLSTLSDVQFLVDRFPWSLCPTSTESGFSTSTSA